MLYIEDLMEAAYDIQAHINRIEGENEGLKMELDALKRRNENSRFPVKPFIHPDGKIETIKMVRILENSSLLDAKNKVDGWVRDGLVNDSKMFEAPVSGALPWRKSSAYIKGTEVTHNGRRFRAVSDIRAGDCDMGGPGSRSCYAGHWVPVERAPQFVERKAYRKGDRVILKGVLAEAKVDISAETCDAIGAEGYGDGRLCIFDHWKRIDTDEA